MTDHHFISYSNADAAEFALWLADELTAGPPPYHVWLDKRDLRAGRDWDEQIDEALRKCETLLYVMTRDSVDPTSVTKQEWSRVLRYGKPIVPLRLHADAELPFRLANRQYIDFSRDRQVGLAQLRQYLAWLSGPEGQLQIMKDQLADLRRDLRRARDESSQQRITKEIAELERQIGEAEQNGGSAPPQDPAAQERALAVSPEPSTESVAPPGAQQPDMSGYDNRPLYGAMKQRLDTGDMQDLAFNLDVDYDDLPGSNRSAKIRELILYMERRDQVPELLKALTAMREKVDWYEVAGVKLG